MPPRQPSPEQRARQQLRDIRIEVLKSLKNVERSYPSPTEAARILAEHQERLSRIAGQGRVQPRLPARRVHRDLPLAINLSWSALMIALVVLVSWLTGGEMWPVLLPLAFWVVVGAFVWTVGVPYLLLAASVLGAALLEFLLYAGR
jgi:hypothetical protein